jgi:hypothetical protein
MPPVLNVLLVREICTLAHCSSHRFRQCVIPGEVRTDFSFTPLPSLLE